MQIERKKMQFAFKDINIPDSRFADKFIFN